MTCKFCEDYKELREMLEEKQARRKSKFVAVLREEKVLNLKEGRTNGT